MHRQNYFSSFEKLFWHLSKQMANLWKDIYSQTFPGSQSHIMFTLQKNGPQKMSELADDLHITAGAVTSASNHLIEHGYIVRICDEQDRRIVRLDLTEKGSKTHKELQAEGKKIIKSVYHCLSKHDLKTLHTAIEKTTINKDNMRNNLKCRSSIGP